MAKMVSRIPTTPLGQKRPGQRLERDLHRAVGARLDTIPGLVWRKRHGSAFQVAGDPDVYFLWRGRHVEIELKRPGEEPTAIQLHRLEEWKEGGAVVAVVHSIEEFEVLLSRCGS